MNEIQRPTFYEGQIISAADLDGVVANARGQHARHERYLHRWGIAEGLHLEDAARETPGGDAYVEVTVSPGVAIDGTGRQIVVSEPERLSEDLFDQLNVFSDNTAYYPVFLIGRDQAPPASEAPMSACQDSEPTRVSEGFEITFGRVGDAADLDDQQPIEVADGPGGALGSAGWRVLLGFVQWDGEDKKIKRFTAVAEQADGIGRRYAGVRADDVIARGGSLTLRSAERGENGTAAIVIDNDNGCELRFGCQDSTGKVVPVFTVNAQGDVRAEGNFIGGITGGVQVESGIATDGVLLPLPTGITQEQVDAGKVLLQIQVTPHYQELPLLPLPVAPVRWLMTPIECRTEDRRVFSRFRWAHSDNANPIDLPGVCDYIVMTFAAPD